MAAPGKPYGLILPKKLQLQKNACVPKHSAFADDSDDETSVEQTLQKEAFKKRVMKQTKLEMQRALEEDSSVYDYDNIYDDMQKKKEENAAQVVSGKDRKPKYIQNILKAAEVRKKEQEKRMEKNIQKEREMEGDEFKDKEAFVTSAYKKKLEEKAEEEEREKREAALEASLDVTKQKDLSGFYRHLLNQTVGEEETPECSLRDSGVKQETLDEGNTKSPEENIDADSNLGTEPSEDEDAADKKLANKSKHYRKQRHSSTSSEEDDDRKEKDRSKNNRDWKEESEEKPRLGKQGDKERHRKGEESDSELRPTARREKKISNKDSKRDDGGHRKRGEEEYFDKERERSKKDKERMDDRKERERASKEYRQREYEDKSEKEHKGRSDRGHEHRRDRERGERSDREYEERSGRDRSERDSRSRSDKERGERSDRERGSYREQGDKEEDDKSYKDKKHSEHSKKRSTSPSEMPDEKMSASKSEAGESQKVDNSSTSKFAKRTNEETVVSARDRYLARQMARAGTKAYVEKEED